MIIYQDYQIALKLNILRDQPNVSLDSEKFQCQQLDEKQLILCLQNFKNKAEHQIINEEKFILLSLGDRLQRDLLILLIQEIKVRQILFEKFKTRYISQNLCDKTEQSLKSVIYSERPRDSINNLDETSNIQNITEQSIQVNTVYESLDLRSNKEQPNIYNADNMLEYKYSFWINQEIEQLIDELQMMLQINVQQQEKIQQGQIEVKNLQDDLKNTIQSNNQFIEEFKKQYDKMQKSKGIDEKYLLLKQKNNALLQEMQQYRVQSVPQMEIFSADSSMIEKQMNDQYKNEINQSMSETLNQLNEQIGTSEHQRQTQSIQKQINETQENIINELQFEFKSIQEQNIEYQAQIKKLQAKILRYNEKQKNIKEKSMSVIAINHDYELENIRLKEIINDLTEELQKTKAKVRQVQDSFNQVQSQLQDQYKQNFDLQSLLQKQSPQKPNGSSQVKETMTDTPVKSAEKKSRIFD